MQAAERILRPEDPGGRSVAGGRPFPFFMKSQTLLKLIAVAGALALAGCRSESTDAVADANPAPVADADAALARLRAGNARYRGASTLVIPGVAARRAALTKGQHPSAVIVACSDSRVSPELIFNSTLGELFVLRTAGEVAGDFELGSIEYAVEHLDAKLVVVLGHTSCGAVSAACADDGHAEGHIHNLVDAIHPAVDAVKNAPGDKRLAAIDENARMIAEHLSKSEPLKSELSTHKTRVVTARYDIATGEVIWF